MYCKNSLKNRACSTFICRRNDTTLTVGHEDGGLRIYSVSQNLNGTNIGTVCRQYLYYSFYQILVRIMN